MPWWAWALTGGVVLFGAAGWLLGRALRRLDQSEERKRPAHFGRLVRRQPHEDRRKPPVDVA